MEDEEWDLELIQQLVRKEEEAVAAKREQRSQNLLLTNPPALDNINNKNINNASASIAFHASSSSPSRNTDIPSNSRIFHSAAHNSKSYSLLEKEFERLSEQLNFAEQEKMDILRDRDDKCLQLKKAVDLLRAKEVELEGLKKMISSNTSFTPANDRTENLKFQVVEVEDSLIDSVKRPALVWKEDKNMSDDAMWSRPWKDSPRKHPLNEASTINDISEPKGSRKKHGYLACQGELSTTASLLTKCDEIASERGETSTQHKTGLHDLRALLYKLQCTWGLTKNMKGTNLISELFATCEMDLCILLQGNQNLKEEVDEDITRIFNSGHLLDINRNNVSNNMNELSPKLYHVLGQVAHSIASVEDLVETLFEFCFLKDVKIVCSALKILEYTVNHYSDSYGGYLLQCRKNYVSQCLEIFQKRNLKHLQHASYPSFNRNISQFDAQHAIDPFCRLYFKEKTSDSKWKSIKDNALVTNVLTPDQITFKNVICSARRFNCESISTLKTTVFRKLHQMLLNSEDSEVKLQVLSTMNSIIMNCSPRSERAQFGPLMFYKNISELLRTKAGTPIQLQALQTLFLLLNCPLLFTLFVGLESDIQAESGDQGTIIDTSTIEGTSDLIVQGLVESISPTNYDQRDYKLLQHALHVIAFIASSGNIGIASLLGFTCDFMDGNANSLDDPRKSTSSDEKACISRMKSDICAHQDGTGQQNLTIPEILVSILNAELDITVNDLTPESHSSDVCKERTALIHEMFLLLHAFCSNVKYGAYVMVKLTDNKSKQHICCNMLTNLTSWFEYSKCEKVDIFDLAHDLVQRISFHINDT